jgi:hypothetical protein
LAGEGRENQIIFYELGAAQAVSRALEMFPTDENIQEWGTRAFAELASENASNQMAVLDAAGCSALVGALARFPQVLTYVHIDIPISIHSQTPVDTYRHTSIHPYLHTHPRR